MPQNSVFNWGKSTRSHKKRPRGDDYDSDEDLAVSHSHVRCVGNQIYFNCPVDDSSVGELVRLIEHKNFEFRMISAHELVGEIEPAPLYLHINTDGGLIFSAMWAVDAILASRIPIHTVINGRACSAGTIMSVVGKKRYMTRHSYMLIHQLRSGVIGKYNDIQQEYENSTQMMEDISRIYATHSKLPVDKVKELLNKDHYWNLEKCQEYGLVDEEWTGVPSGGPVTMTLEDLLLLTQQHARQTGSQGTRSESGSDSGSGGAAEPGAGGEDPTKKVLEPDHPAPDTTYPASTTKTPPTVRRSKRIRMG